VNIHGISLGLWLCGGRFTYGRAQHAPVTHRVRASELGVRTAPAARSLAVPHRRVGAYRALTLNACVPAHGGAWVEAGCRETAMVPAADTSAHFVPFVLFNLHQGV